jgi:hypothetical protein
LASPSANAVVYALCDAHYLPQRRDPLGAGLVPRGPDDVVVRTIELLCSRSRSAAPSTATAPVDEEAEMQRLELESAAVGGGAAGARGACTGAGETTASGDAKDDGPAPGRRLGRFRRGMFASLLQTTRALPGLSQYFSNLTKGTLDALFQSAAAHPHTLIAPKLQPRDASVSVPLFNGKERTRSDAHV